VPTGKQTAGTLTRRESDDRIAVVVSLTGLHGPDHRQDDRDRTQHHPQQQDKRNENDRQHQHGGDHDGGEDNDIQQNRLLRDAGDLSRRKRVSAPDPLFLDQAWSVIAAAAGRAGLAVVLGTERIVDDALRISVLVIDRDGTIAGFQDKVQLDPSEEGTYTPGAGRRLFQTGPLTFGVAICHEGWRYPETVRWAAQRGAHIVSHPHFHEPEPGGYTPSTFADPRNSFHEKAALCRAAENSCLFATVNCASVESPTTSTTAHLGRWLTGR
jgi:hypothetical protein